MPKKINIIKPLVATILMMLSCSGMVFAKEISQKIYDNFFGISKGMETAMNEGYVENIDMENQASTGNAKNDNVKNGLKVIFGATKDTALLSFDKFSITSSDFLEVINPAISRVI